MNGGELFTHLYQREKFTEDEVRIYIGEIIIAIEHLHRVSETMLHVFAFGMWLLGKETFLFLSVQTIKRLCLL